MASVHVRDNAGQQGSSGTTFGHTVTTPGTGNILLVGVCVRETNQPSVSGCATTWTRLGTDVFGATPVRTELWLGEGPFSGTTVTVTKGSGIQTAAGSSEFSGTEDFARAAAVTADGSDSAAGPGYAGPAIAATIVGDLLFAQFGIGDNGTSISSGPGGGYTQAFVIQAGASSVAKIIAAYQITSDTSSHTATFKTNHGGSGDFSSVGLVIPAVIPLAVKATQVVGQAVNRAANF